MAVYTIIRIYEIPAESRQQATDRMLEALFLHVEKDYHVKDVIREPGRKAGEGTPINLYPTGWLQTIKEQLGLAGKK